MHEPRRIKRRTVHQFLKTNGLLSFSSLPAIASCSLLKTTKRNETGRKRRKDRGRKRGGSLLITGKNQGAKVTTLDEEFSYSIIAIKSVRCFHSGLSFFKQLNHCAVTFLPMSTLISLGKNILLSMQHFCFLDSNCLTTK